MYKDEDEEGEVSKDKEVLEEEEPGEPATWDETRVPCVGSLQHIS